MLVPVTPEQLDTANLYLQYGNVKDVAEYLRIPETQVVEIISSNTVKRYIDQVYLDMGYRNRDKIAQIMDEIIESKLEEARDTEMYTNKDLVDLLALQHKMRMEEIKAMQNAEANETKKAKPQTLVKEQSNYDRLMAQLLNG